MSTPNRTVIPVSGGIDSLILADMNPSAFLLFVDYGQPYADAEKSILECCFKIAKFS